MVYFFSTILIINMNIIMFSHILFFYMIKDYIPCQYPFCRKKTTLIAFPLLHSHRNSTTRILTTFFILRIDGVSHRYIEDG